MRLSAKSKPVEDRRLELEERAPTAPGTNSARWIRISIVDGAMRTVDAAPVALVDELDRLLLREVGVGDDDLLDAVLGEDCGELVERPERAQAVVGARRQRDEADASRRGVWPSLGERVGDRLDVLARADEQRAAAVARRAQQQPGDLLVEPSATEPT